MKRHNSLLLIACCFFLMWSCNRTEEIAEDVNATPTVQNALQFGAQAMCCEQCESGCFLTMPWSGTPGTNTPYQVYFVAGDCECRLDRNTGLWHAYVHCGPGSNGPSNQSGTYPGPGVSPCGRADIVMWDLWQMHCTSAGDPFNGEPGLPLQTWGETVAWAQDQIADEDNDDAPGIYFWDDLGVTVGPVAPDGPIRVDLAGSEQAQTMAGIPVLFQYL
ncbi:MAG: hypothetical protein AAF570_14385 [Bacteroidota bacterium]